MRRQSVLVLQPCAVGDDASFEVVRAASVDELLGRLDAETFDAVLLPAALGREGGLATISAVHEHSPDVPIVVLAGAGDGALAVEAVRHGAQDCLLAGTHDDAMLARAVSYAIERQRRQSALRAISLVDELTGLYNRRGFLTLAQQQFRVADRLKTNVWQIFLDLDGLKQINDTYGHQEGDRALVAMAELLSATFRHSDVIARIGGDEFAVLALETHDVPAEAVVTRLYENLGARNAALGARYELAFSLGLAFYDAASPCSVAELLARADAWMYAQKRKKRGVSAPAGPVLLPFGDARLDAARFDGAAD